MFRSVRAAVLAAVIAGTLASTVGAAEPTCSDVSFLGIVVHGQHVVRDYVSGGTVGDWPPPGGAVGEAIGGSGAALPGGPGPAFHFPAGVAPGASFCNPQSVSPGFHVP